MRRGVAFAVANPSPGPPPSRLFARTLKLYVWPLPSSSPRPLDLPALPCPPGDRAVQMSSSRLVSVVLGWTEVARGTPGQCHPLIARHRNQGFEGGEGFSIWAAAGRATTMARTRSTSRAATRHAANPVCARLPLIPTSALTLLSSPGSPGRVLRNAAAMSTRRCEPGALYHDACPIQYCERKADDKTTPTGQGGWVLRGIFHPHNEVPAGLGILPVLRYTCANPEVEASERYPARRSPQPRVASAGAVLHAPPGPRIGAAWNGDGSTVTAPTPVRIGSASPVRRARARCHASRAGRRPQAGPPRHAGRLRRGSHSPPRRP